MTTTKPEDQADRYDLDEDEVYERLEKLDLNRVLRTLDRHLNPLVPSPSSTGNVYLPDRAISFMSVIEETLTGQHRESSNLEAAFFSPIGEAVREFWLDERLFAEVEWGWITRCSNPDSLASGRWGLLQFTRGRRGYVYYDGREADDFVQSLRVLAAWEPASDGSAAEHARLRAYVENWKQLCLPPQMGAAVSTDPEFLFSAIKAILEADQRAIARQGKAWLSSFATKQQVWRTIDIDKNASALAARCGCAKVTARRAAMRWLELLMSPNGVKELVPGKGLDRESLAWLFVDLVAGGMSRRGL